MALTFRLATQQDAQGIQTLVQANDADLIADYGSYVWQGMAPAAVIAELKAHLADGSMRLIVADNSGTIAGVALFWNHSCPVADLGTDAWECILTVIDSSFTAAQRAHGFWQMLIWIQQHDNAAFVWGRVRVGRRLDTMLATVASNTRVLDPSDANYAYHYGPVAPLNAGAF